jgi:hypothetical protein
MVECFHAECHYAECRYAECRGAFKLGYIEPLVLKRFWPFDINHLHSSLMFAR